MRKSTLLFFFIFFATINSHSQSKERQSLARQWMMISFDGYTKMFLIKNKAEINLVKLQDDQYSAYMGCNRLYFKVNIRNRRKIKFYAFSITKKYCKDNDNLEIKFTQLLSKMTDYKVEGHFLTLSNAEGIEMKFVAADWD